MDLTDHNGEVAWRGSTGVGGGA
nr:hypothetical protein [Pseudomonas sp. UBA7500]